MKENIFIEKELRFLDLILKEWKINSELIDINTILDKKKVWYIYIDYEYIESSYYSSKDESIETFHFIADNIYNRLKECNIVNNQILEDLGNSNESIGVSYSIDLLKLYFYLSYSISNYEYDISKNIQIDISIRGIWKIISYFKCDLCYKEFEILDLFKNIFWDEYLINLWNSNFSLYYIYFILWNESLGKIHDYIKNNEYNNDIPKLNYIFNTKWMWVNDTKESLFFTSNDLDLELNYSHKIIYFNKKNKRVAHIDLNKSDFWKILQYCLEDNLKLIKIQEGYKYLKKNKWEFDSNKAFISSKSNFISNNKGIKKDIDYLITKEIRGSGILKLQFDIRK